MLLLAADACGCCGSGGEKEDGGRVAELVVRLCVCCEADTLCCLGGVRVEVESSGWIFVRG